MLKDIELSQSRSRAFCWRCRQPDEACYCSEIRRFDPEIEFVVLIHKIESRRRIATGRMSHLILERSRLIQGSDFETNREVIDLIDRPDFYPVVLYPGTGAIDLTFASPAEMAALKPQGRRLSIFVIDGTWATARKTMRLSPNLARLPRVCFSPTRKSQFKVRKQPADFCLSTLEAIHETIERLGASQGFDVMSRRHDHLLDVFLGMVDRQSRFVPSRDQSE